jgi:hypothetical protein
MTKPLEVDTGKATGGGDRTKSLEGDRTKPLEVETGYSHWRWRQDKATGGRHDKATGGGDKTKPLEGDRAKSLEGDRDTFPKGNG